MTIERFPSAPTALESALEALKKIKATLEFENSKAATGAIRATIWHGPGETLFDFLDNSIAALTFDVGIEEAGLREAFEAWIATNCGDLSTFGSPPNLHYRNSAVNNAWSGWKARAVHEMARGSQDRAYAQAYLRQAEALLTGNEVTLHAENERLRAELAASSVDIDELPPAGHWERDEDGRVMFTASDDVQVEDGEQLFTYSQIVQNLVVHASPEALRNAKDAARYRWLREGRKGTYNTVMIHAGSSLDQAVDAAMALGAQR